ncbi:MAG: YHS domain-containing protein [Burkholderiaceae bacterium]|nr:YHS domain-containing protein [Burkholderiaceae bacterium]
MSHLPVRRLNRRTLLVVTLSGWLASSRVHAAQPPINTLTGGFFGGTGDTAILGYDTVAYFTDGRPVKGSDSFVTTWMGAKWKFSTQAHLDLFKATPEKYAPQYGGYCAYGVSVDNLVSIEPDKFKIIDGKLYLNYDADVQQKWLKNPIGFIKTADSKFPSLLKQ